MKPMEIKQIEKEIWTRIFRSLNIGIKNGLDKEIDRLSLTLIHDESIKRELGITCYHSLTHYITLKFNFIIYKCLTEIQKEELIKHELAHCIDFMLRGKSDHFSNWRSLVKRFGGVPSRLSTPVLNHPYFPVTIYNAKTDKLFNISIQNYNHNKHKIDGINIFAEVK